MTQFSCAFKKKNVRIFHLNDKPLIHNSDPNNSLLAAQGGTLHNLCIVSNNSFYFNHFGFFESAATPSPTWKISAGLFLQPEVLLILLSNANYKTCYSKLELQERHGNTFVRLNSVEFTSQLER